MTSILENSTLSLVIVTFIAHICHILRQECICKTPVVISLFSFFTFALDHILILPIIIFWEAI